MHHRHKAEHKFVAAERKPRAFTHHNVIVPRNAVISAHHFKGFLVAHDFRIGIELPEKLQSPRMVRLHVVHDYVVNRAVSYHLADVLQVLLKKSVPHAVNHSHLFVVYDIGVIAHAVGQRPH